MNKILYFAGGLLILTFLAFICIFAYIIYKDEDDGWHNTPLEWVKRHCDKNRSWACLKFKDWKKYYALAPNEWNLKWFAPSRTIRKENIVWDFVYINFGFIGNIKYVFFKYNIKRKRNKDKFNKNSQDSLRYVLEAVQGDIEEIQKKVEEETNKAKKEIDKIRKSYLNEESYLNKEIELKSTDKWEN